MKTIYFAGVCYDNADDFPVIEKFFEEEKKKIPCDLRVHQRTSFLEKEYAAGIKEVSIRTPCYMDSYLICRHMEFRDAQQSCQYLFMKLKEEE